VKIREISEKKISSTSKQTFMKKIILFTTGIILIMTACKKTDKQINTNPASEFTIASLKGWFNTQFSKSSEYQLNNGVTLKQPWWKAGRIYDMGAFKVAEMPLLINKRRVYVAENIGRSEAERVVASTIYKALFIKTPSGKIEARIAQFTPTYTYLSRKNFNLGNLSFKDYATEFKGTVLLYDFAGHFKKGYHLGDDGHIKNLTVNPPRNADGNITNNQPCTNLDPNCHYLMHIVYEYACSNGWNVNEGFNPDYCYITQVVSEECELLYCDGGPNDNMENCMASGMTSAQCFCALYGIGCGGDDSQECTQFQQQCEEAASMTIEPEKSSMPSAPTVKDTTIRWIVAAHAFGTWRIVAYTNVVYQGIVVNNVYKTHISHLKTVTQYEGSNAIIETTWTPTNITDNILVNDSPTAKTKSTVVGDIYHKCKSAPHPLCAWLKKHEGVSNELEMDF
jgi:hypothetical protein